MRSHNRLCVLAVGWLIGLLLLPQVTPFTQAQTTNITFSSVGTHIEQSGNTTNIFMNIETPRRSGPNVFHSFGRFDLGAGDIANFVRPDTVATTVISRVTGGVSSNINGTIQALGWSNFYFINPSGVVFGPSASLNVPNGSVYISTAQSVRFANGGVFNSQSVGSQEVLSSFPVSSFGFTQSTTVAPITISGNNLSVPSGKTLAVIGGPVTIDGAQLKAPGGTVQVASVGYGGEVTVAKNFVLGYGGEVLSFTPTFEASGPVGSITMSPGSSFAALDAGPNGTVQTIPAPANIQTPAGSQKIVQSNLIKIEAPVTSPGVVLPPGANETGGLSSAIQYPRVLAIPQLTIAAPRLLADKCAGVKDGQFSSLAQLNRDSSPPQPGRYLSSPTILDEALLRTGQSSAPDLSISMGAPALLTIAADATFLVRNDCVP